MSEFASVEEGAVVESDLGVVERSRDLEESLANELESERVPWSFRGRRVRDSVEEAAHAEVVERIDEEREDGFDDFVFEGVDGEGDCTCSTWNDGGRRRRELRKEEEESVQSGSKDGGSARGLIQAHLLGREMKLSTERWLRGSGCQRRRRNGKNGGRDDHGRLFDWSCDADWN